MKRTLRGIILAAAILAAQIPVSLAASAEPGITNWKYVMVEGNENKTTGASYPNWDSYCANVSDTITAGVGADTTKGVRVASTAPGTSGYCQPFYACDKSGDYSGAEELWIWVDFSNYSHPGSLRFRPRLNGSDWSDFIYLQPDSPVYFQAGSGWRTVTTAGSGEAMISGSDLEGYKGYIRFPLRSFSNVPSSIAYVNGAYLIFDFSFATEDGSYVENAFVLDNLLFAGPSMNGNKADELLDGSLAPVPVTPQSQAAAVDALIAALTDPEAVGPSDREPVTDARAAYEELSAEAKALVTRLSKLENCEEALEGRIGAVAGSFIQPWLFRDWTPSRWDQEMKLMSLQSIHYLILQYTADNDYSDSISAYQSVYGQDYSQYTRNGSYVVYPSQLPQLQAGYNGKDQLEYCLSAAKKYGMQVLIGLNMDNRWWLYGWGNPTLKPGETDPVAGSYFADYIQQDAGLSAQMMQEIWSLYGGEYSDQIYGWYFVPEVWNFDAACSGADNGSQARIVGNMLNIYLNAAGQITPGKPLAVSPFINFTLSTAAQYGQFWQSIFAAADFRGYDIFMPQDSVGNNPSQLSALSQWIAAINGAAVQEGMHAWINNETYAGGGTPADISRISQQFSLTDPYAERHVVFSWNHYENPLVSSSYQSAYDDLKAFIFSQGFVG